MPHSTPRLITLVQKRPGLRADPAPEHDRDVVGAQRELVADRLLEPAAARLPAVEDSSVGELELAEGELVAVASLAVFGGQRRGQDPLPAAEEAPDVAGREPGADRGQCFAVRAGAEAVIEGTRDCQANWKCGCASEPP